MNVADFCFLKNCTWCLENCTFHISAMLSIALKGERKKELCENKRERKKKEEAMG
jgi:hypothetical protein